MRNTVQFNFVDLFCGAGGLSSGLEKAGMNCVLGTDQEKSAIATFKINHKNSEAFTDEDGITKVVKRWINWRDADVRNVEELKPLLEFIKQSYDANQK